MASAATRILVPYTGLLVIHGVMLLFPKLSLHSRLTSGCNGTEKTQSSGLLGGKTAGRQHHTSGLPRGSQ